MLGVEVSAVEQHAFPLWLGSLGISTKNFIGLAILLFKHEFILLLYFHETFQCVKYLFTGANDQNRGFLRTPRTSWLWV